MSKIATLVYDTETTGLVNFKAPVGEIHEARLLQLGAQLIEIDTEKRSLKVIDEICLDVCPEEDYVCNEMALKTHGLDAERISRYGIPPYGAIGLFLRLLSIADVVSCYNAAYDHRIVGSELSRAAKSYQKTFSFALDHLRNKTTFCLKEAFTPICAIPAPWGTGHKWPKLEEAYERCYGCKFEGAHNALADVKATVEIFEWWLESEHFNEHTLLNGNIEK